MKAKNLLLLSIIFSMLFFSACGDSDNDPNPPTPDPPDPKPDTDQVYTNKWIYKQMKGLYLWDQHTTPPQYKQETKVFFSSLLYRSGKVDGDRFSWIEEDEDSKKSSKAATSGLGFEIIPQNYFTSESAQNSNIGFFVTYVREGSDAQTKGLKRGNVIYEVDDAVLTYNNYADMYYHILTTATVSVGVYDENGNKKTINSIQSNLSYDDENPIWFSKLITKGTTKIGYIVYNQFEKGDDYEYDIKLVQTVSKLITDGAKDMIIDLRYNPGGYVISATHLASALVPNRNTENTFLRYSYNPTRNDSLSQIYGNYVPFFDKISGTTENISAANLNSLYIIATENSASASEALINGLRPYMSDKLKHVGTTTMGKDKGSWAIKAGDDRIKWQLQPLTMRVLNKNSNIETGGHYQRGLTPDIKVNEWEKGYTMVRTQTTDVFGDLIHCPMMSPWKGGWGELGDADEILLATAIASITGQPLPTSTKSVTVKSISAKAPTIKTFRKPQMIVETIEAE